VVGSQSPKVKSGNQAMFNPLSPDLTQLSEIDLEKRINSLLNRMRTGSEIVYDQSRTLLDECYWEQDRRVMQEVLEEQRKRDSGESDDPFGGLIDV